MLAHGAEWGLCTFSGKDNPSSTQLFAPWLSDVTLSSFTLLHCDLSSELDPTLSNSRVAQNNWDITLVNLAVLLKYG